MHLEPSMTHVLARTLARSQTDARTHARTHTHTHTHTRTHTHAHTHAHRRINKYMHMYVDLIACVCVQMGSATASADREKKIPNKKLKTIQTLIAAGANVLEAVDLSGQDEAGLPSLNLQSSDFTHFESFPLPPEIVHLMMPALVGAAPL